MSGVVWITGLPASGKTTLARALIEELEARALRATLIDSDEARTHLTPQATYSAHERTMVYRAMAYAARRLAEQGVIVVVAATTHSKALRDEARAIVPQMLLVHARCPLAECKRRDPKGLFLAAHADAHGSMPGVHVDYEEPVDADATIDTFDTVRVSDLNAIVERVIDAAPR